MHGAHEDALPEADPSPEDGGEECGICYAAEIEVQIDSCKHGMCIECARAICSMPVSHLFLHSTSLGPPAYVACFLAAGIVWGTGWQTRL